MEKHCARPGSPSAQGGLAFSPSLTLSHTKKTISAGPVPICPLSAAVAVVSRSSEPPALDRDFSFLCSAPPLVRRAFKAPSVSPRSAVFRPCQFSVPPSVDDRRSCDAAAAASVKMVVSCLHNGSGVRRRAQAGTGPVSWRPNRSVDQAHPRLLHHHHHHVASSKKTQNTLF